MAAWAFHAAEEAGAHPVCEAWAAICGPPPELCAFVPPRPGLRRNLKAQSPISEIPSQAAQQRRVLATATALFVWQRSRSLPETYTGILEFNAACGCGCLPSKAPVVHRHGWCCCMRSHPGGPSRKKTSETCVSDCCAKTGA